MRSSSYYLVVFLFFISSVSFAQNQKKNTHRDLIVFNNDVSIQTSILLVEKEFTPDILTEYYWYYNNEIKHNIGDYNGKLLDGMYQVTDIDGNLIEKGLFVNGTKSGLWKEWDSKGGLLATYTWHKGIKEGIYKKYKEGLVIEQGCYKKNKLNGKVRVYESDTISSVVKYKNGVCVVEKKVKEKKEETIESDPKKKERKKWMFWKKKEEKTDEEAKEKIKGKTFIDGLMFWKKKDDSIDQKKKKNKSKEQQSEKKKSPIKIKKKGKKN